MSAVPRPAGWQAGFLAAVLPAVQTHAAIRFRRLPAAGREEAVQEAVAAACVSYRLLAAKGRLAAARPGTVADFAVKHVRNGRHVGGRQDAARDAMSPAAARRHGVRVVSYHQLARPGGATPGGAAASAAGPGGGGAWRVQAVAGRRDAVPDTACFRVDFERWLGGLTARDRAVVAALAAGERTSAVARQFGITGGRVSQLRRKFERAWRAFQGEAA